MKILEIKFFLQMLTTKKVLNDFFFFLKLNEFKNKNLIYVMCQAKGSN